MLEILLVVGAIGILAGIVILALNPTKQLGDTRNAKRRADVNTVVNAIYQYAIDNNGTMPGSIDSNPDSAQVLGTDLGGCNTSCSAVTTVASCVSLTAALVPTYIVGIPYDPSSGSDDNTDYYVNKDANGRITVGSCNPEQGATISVVR